MTSDSHIDNKPLCQIAQARRELRLLSKRIMIDETQVLHNILFQEHDAPEDTLVCSSSKIRDSLSDIPSSRIVVRDIDARGV